MAGETALSAYASTGVYLLMDNNGWVAGNTPNTCNLGGDSGLTLGTGFMYFDDFIGLDENVTTERAGAFIGWKFTPHNTTYLNTKGRTGQNKFNALNLRVHADETQRQNFLKFFDYHQSASALGQLYIVVQWASTTFMQFSTNATLYKYLAIVPVGCRTVTTMQEGMYIHTLDIQLVNALREQV